MSRLQRLWVGWWFHLYHNAALTVLADIQKGPKAKIMSAKISEIEISPRWNGKS